VYRSRVANEAHTADEGDASAPEDAAAGTVLRADRRLVVACGTGAVELTEVQQPGRDRLEAADFLNGYALAPGDRLGA
jgi:methionyl-tRNA formyltransferase